ncbi:MAG: hypothetical protein RID09_05290 [Coleofasciculus sp. G1-WW12-02]|uniref:hypothetical protein n=1 Tax=unclassified Coleofasciculus TaxID=2692782 RepID=UPI0032F76FA8
MAIHPAPYFYASVGMNRQFNLIGSSSLPVYMVGMDSQLSSIRYTDSVVSDNNRG